jgi:hypothetical protein
LFVAQLSNPKVACFCPAMLRAIASRIGGQSQISRTKHSNFLVRQQSRMPSGINCESLSSKSKVFGRIG